MTAFRNTQRPRVQNDLEVAALGGCHKGMHRPPAPGLMADRTALSGGSCGTHAARTTEVVKVGASAAGHAWGTTPSPRRRRVA